MSNRSSAGALIGDTANWNQQSTQIKSSQTLVFEKRGNRSTRRKPLGAEQRNNKLNPHMTPDLAGNRSWATLVGGECSHHCAIPALLAPFANQRDVILHRSVSKKTETWPKDDSYTSLNPFYKIYHSLLTCCVSFTFPQHNVWKSLGVKSKLFKSSVFLQKTNKQENSYQTIQWSQLGAITFNRIFLELRTADFLVRWMV